MKNTMKKLLCMTLVIMLLISAVPVFAAAEGESTMDLTGKTLIYSYRDKDTNEEVQRYVGTQALDRPFTYEEITNSASMFFTRTDYRILTVDTGNPSTEGNNVIVKVTVEKVRIETFSLVIELVVEGEGTHEYNVGSIAATDIPDGGLTMSRADALIKLNGQGDAYDITASEAHSQALTNKVVFSFSAVKKSNTGSGSGSTGGSGSGSTGGTGTGTTAKFKATFLNANGLECYSEEVVSGGKIGKAASELNALVGTKAGYEHIGWKSSAGKTQTTEELLRDTITANVTYAPMFRNLTNNSIEVPGSGIISGGSNNTVSNGSGSALHDKVTGLQDVILHVYLNNNFNSEHKHYTITDIAKDGTLSLKGDVKDFLKKYYTAKTSDGIGYDGMYVTDAYFGVKYLSDEKYEVLGNDADANGNTTLDKMRSAGVVHLNVMLTNATAKSSSTADSSNYKTGDTIFVPVMAMGLTGTLLAAAYIFGKKRFAR